MKDNIVNQILPHQNNCWDSPCDCVPKEAPPGPQAILCVHGRQGFNMVRGTTRCKECLRREPDIKPEPFIIVEVVNGHGTKGFKVRDLAGNALNMRKKWDAPVKAKVFRSRFGALLAGKRRVNRSKRYMQRVQRRQALNKWTEV